MHEDACGCYVFGDIRDALCLPRTPQGEVSFEKEAKICHHILSLIFRVTKQMEGREDGLDDVNFKIYYEFRGWN